MTAELPDITMPTLATSRPRRPIGRTLSLPLLATTLALLGACAAVQVPRPTAGQSEAEVIARLGPPTGRYTLPAGGQRLEYATGPYGRTTWMVDLDSAGKVTGSFQALTEANFMKVRDGMPRDEVLRMLGRPADQAGEYMNRQTWSWRYPTYECLWARITFEPDGKVRGGASLMTDPRCDVDH